MDQSVLCAFLRRSGPMTKRRARFLFWALTQVRLSPSTPAADASKEMRKSRQVDEEDEEDDDDGSSGGTKVAVDNMCSILLFGLVKRAPRFVFVCGANSTVLRSADRGRTFRRISVAGAPPAVVSTHPPIPTTERATVDDGEGLTTATHAADDATLREIIRLLPNGGSLREATGAGGPGDDGDDDDDEQDGNEGDAGISQDGGTDKSAGLPPAANNDVFSIATYEDFVAVGGANGLIALSADRGATFASLPVAALLRASSRVKDRTRSTNVAVSIRGVAFGTSTTLLFHSTSSLLAVDFTRLSLNQVAFFPVVRHLHEFETAIGTIVAVPAATSSLMRQPECIVSTANMLHFSYDCGVTFLSVRHSLGLVRCLVDLTTVFVRPAHVPPFPQQPVLQHETAAGAGDSANPRKRFSYATECSLNANNVRQGGKKPVPFAEVDTERTEGSLPSSGAVNALRDCLLQTCSWSYSDAVEGGGGTGGGRYRVFAALSTGGKIVPYDFTSLLFIAVPQCMNKLLVAATNVDYIAFVQSGAADGVGLAVQAGPGERVSYSMVRSTSSGISHSGDLGKTWSSPIHAYMRGCCSLDEGSFIVCNSRKMVAVSEDYGKSFSPISLPFSTLPTLYDIAVME